MTAFPYGACEKGFRGDCCCVCEYHLKISVCGCPVCPKIEGYICTLYHQIDHDYSCTYSQNEHDMCECFQRAEK